MSVGQSRTEKSIHLQDTPELQKQLSKKRKSGKGWESPWCRHFRKGERSNSENADCLPLSWKQREGLWWMALKIKHEKSPRKAEVKWAWWCRSLLLTLRSWKQADFYKLQDSQGCLNKKTKRCSIKTGIRQCKNVLTLLQPPFFKGDFLFF